MTEDGPVAGHLGTIPEEGRQGPVLSLSLIHI